MNSRSNATAAAQSLSYMLREPLAPKSKVPKRHLETGAAVARWFSTATLSARKHFASCVASSLESVGPDLRLLHCINRCLIAERGHHKDNVLLAVLTVSAQPLEQLIEGIRSLAKTRHDEEVRWLLEVLMELVSADAVNSALFPARPHRSGPPEADIQALVCQVMDVAEASLHHAPADAAQLLLRLARAANVEVWSSNPEWRDRLMTSATGMLEAAGPAATAEITTPLHSVITIALNAFDPRRIIGSWASDYGGHMMKQESATAPCKRWARCVPSPHSCRLSKSGCTS